MDKTQVSDFDITSTMIALGGGFVKKLGELYQHGDDVNKQRLRAAFPEYWSEYKDLTIRRRVALATKLAKCVVLAALLSSAACIESPTAPSVPPVMLLNPDLQAIA